MTQVAMKRALLLLDQLRVEVADLEKLGTQNPVAVELVDLATPKIIGDAGSLNVSSSVDVRFEVGVAPTDMLTETARDSVIDDGSPQGNVTIADQLPEDGKSL